MNTGDRLTLTIEKPAAGGRMIARHAGAIVLVSGSIPGEVVEAEIEKVQRGTAWARVARVLEASPSRVARDDDGACGGNVLAHVAYERQLTLKREIIEDAFARIARLPLPGPVDVAGSPASGYRMRARLHVADGRIGFFREGTHALCDAAGTQQLLPETIEVLRQIERTTRGGAARLVQEIELAENCAADQRALHWLLHDDADPSRLGSLPPLAGVRGISCAARLGARPLVLTGTPEVSDTIALSFPAGQSRVTLTRQAHSFFQGNRYLLAPLLQAVIEQVPAGRVLDLYAGVGLFSVALAASGVHHVVAIEGERASAHDLKRNAAQVSGRLEPRHQSVESYLQVRQPKVDVLLVDPPRTGMTKDARRGALALHASRLVYVSCDVATLARDARVIVDSGYRLSHARAFDLFPNTAHVESLVTFDRDERQ